MKHPGKTLWEDFMSPLGVSPHQLASGLGVHRSTIGRLLAGTQRMTPALSARLGAYFQVPARWWLSMQAEYDAYALEQRPALIAAVTPLTLAPDLLLTPKGVLHLGEPSQEPSPISIPRADLDKLPSTSAPQPRSVHMVHYANGSVALVGEALIAHP